MVVTFDRFSRAFAATSLVVACLACVLPASAQALRAEAALEKLQVFLGEPFVFQIRVEGSDSPAKPDLSGLTDFTIQELGGQQNNSQSMTIVNGRMNRVVRRGFTFSYRLTPKKAGNLAIPAITVSADNQTARTQPVTVRATPPAETDDFKLRQSLSERRAYPGQPVTLTVTWYISKNVEGFSFNLPVLADDRFHIADADLAMDRSRPERYVQIPLGQKQVIGEKGTGTLDGRQFTTVRFRKVLIPRKTGKLTLPQGTVSLKAVQGYRKGRRGSMFDEFFNDSFFNFGREAVYQSLVVPSNRPVLEVLELPQAGRPANFSGLVGNYTIAADATPDELNIGDPITLTVRIAGPRHLDNVELPPLGNQPVLERDFKIPQDRAAGAIEGRSKVFTQTLRAKHAEVTQIPPIELSYFDPDSGRYATAKTDPIPLAVNPTRVVTARDAEGMGGSESVQTELESLEGGIAYNYEGFDALENQQAGPAAWLRSPVWIALIGLPPLAYFSLLGFTLLSRARESDPAARRARRSFRELTNSLKAVESSNGRSPEQLDAVLLEALRRYVGGRLGMPPGAITFGDVKPVLEERGASADTIEAFGTLFERCEAGRYAGGALAGQDAATTARRILEVARDLEGSLR